MRLHWLILFSRFKTDDGFLIRPFLLESTSCLCLDDWALIWVFVWILSHYWYQDLILFILHNPLHRAFNCSLIFATISFEVLVTIVLAFFTFNNHVFLIDHFLKTAITYLICCLYVTFVDHGSHNFFRIKRIQVSLCYDRIFSSFIISQPLQAHYHRSTVIRFWNIPACFFTRWLSFFVFCLVGRPVSLLSFKFCLYFKLWVLTVGFLHLKTFDCHRNFRLALDCL